MEVYGRVYRVVEPKKKKLELANRQLAEKQASLHEAKEKLREVKEKLDELQRQYEEKLATKEDLRRKAELTELKLDRAAKVVSGLAGERTRWEESIKVCMYVCMRWRLCGSFELQICDSTTSIHIQLPPIRMF
jgi:dynein heavy chain